MDVKGPCRSEINITLFVKHVFISCHCSLVNLAVLIAHLSPAPILCKALN